MQPILTRLTPIESGVGFHQLQPVLDRGRAGLTQTGTAGTETPVVNSVCVRKLYIPTAAGDGKHKQGIFAVIKTDIETFLPNHLSMYQLHARPAKILLGLIEMVKEFFVALANNASISIHTVMLREGNNHHMAEAIFKAFDYTYRYKIFLEAERRNNLK